MSQDVKRSLVDVAAALILGKLRASASTRQRSGLFRLTRSCGVWRQGDPASRAQGHLGTWPGAKAPRVERAQRFAPG
jgi:hypothetical protein